MSVLRWPALALLLAGGALSVQGVWLPAKAWTAQQLIERAWSKAQDGGRLAPPWPWADTRPIGRLSAPGHGINLYVLAGSSGRNLAFGPAHMSASAAPGKPGNSVVAGHRDTHFRFLERLDRGDRLLLESVDGRRTEYIVRLAEVIDARTAGLALDVDVPVLTLVTCYPFDALEPGGPLRYVVTAYASDAVQPSADLSSTNSSPTDSSTT